MLIRLFGLIIITKRYCRKTKSYYLKMYCFKLPICSFIYLYYMPLNGKKLNNLSIKLNNFITITFM